MVRTFSIDSDATYRKNVVEPSNWCGIRRKISAAHIVNQYSTHTSVEDSESTLQVPYLAVWLFLNIWHYIIIFLVQKRGWKRYFRARFGMAPTVVNSKTGSFWRSWCCSLTKIAIQYSQSAKKPTVHLPHSNCGKYWVFLVGESCGVAQEANWLRKIWMNGRQRCRFPFRLISMTLPSNSDFFYFCNQGLQSFTGMILFISRVLPL